jgi:hypothetical protein
MSTSSKLDPMRKQRSARRVALLRTKPRSRAEAVILAELALIHKSSRLSADTKHELFVRGAKQLSELPK